MEQNSGAPAPDASTEPTADELAAMEALAAKLRQRPDHDAMVIRGTLLMRPEPEVRAALEALDRMTSVDASGAAPAADTPALTGDLLQAVKDLLYDMDCSDFGEEGIDNPSPVTHRAGRKCPVCVARAAIAEAEAATPAEPRPQPVQENET